MKVPKRKLFGTDGIRGIANEFPLTPEMVQKIGIATGHYLKAKFPEKRHAVIVGKDTRNSSDMIASSLIGGLTSVGIDVIDVGITTTPSISFIVKDTSASSGIMVSASHNPFQYNGLKFFNSEGRKLSELEEASLELVIFNKFELPKVKPKEIGRVFDGSRLIDSYVKFITKSAYSLSGLKIAIDCSNGATFQLAPSIFKNLEAETFVFEAEPDGFNINKDCGATNPDFISEKVLESKADMGFAYDGDGDRCIAVDEKGNIIDGDNILAIFAKYFREKKVVATIMSNMGLELSLASKGIKLIRTSVGDRNVFEKMEEIGSRIGGEQSGHVILRDFLDTGDGILTSVVLASIVKETGIRLSELAKLEKFPQKIKNLKVTEKRDIKTLKKVQNSLDEANKLLKDEGRIVIRYSGTEPLVRIMVEARDETLMEKVIAKIVKAFRDEGLIEKEH